MAPKEERDHVETQEHLERRALRENPGPPVHPDKRAPLDKRVT